MIVQEYYDYIEKVMWYAKQEYGIPSVSIEQFEKESFYYNYCFTYFANNYSFQNCCRLLVGQMKNLNENNWIRKND